MLSKLIRLTKDAEVGTTPTGKQVVKISGVYNIGYGDNQKPVWIQASAWGERYLKLAQYLLKGTQVVLHADDVEPNAYTSDKGTSLSLRMTVVNIELVAKNNAMPATTQPTSPVTPSYTAPSDDDLDDDIPF